jgi:hypothetical protein
MKDCGWAQADHKMVANAFQITVGHARLPMLKRRLQRIVAFLSDLRVSVMAAAVAVLGVCHHPNRSHGVEIHDCSAGQKRPKMRDHLFLIFFMACCSIV